MLIGTLVTLRAVEKADLPALKNWRNNPEFRKHFREYRDLNDNMQDEWFEKKAVNDPSTEMFSILMGVSDELIGCGGLTYINWVQRHADLSLYIGWKDAYIDEEGYAEETCRLLLDYAFKEVGLNKVWTEIYEFDEKKHQLYKGLGFQQDGLLRENYFYDGKWWNSRIISVLAKEYLG